MIYALYTCHNGAGQLADHLDCQVEKTLDYCSTPATSAYFVVPGYKDYRAHIQTIMIHERRTSLETVVVSINL